MTKFIESGHLKNVANLEHLIAVLTSYGTNYNPAKNELKLTALATLLTNSQNALTVVKDNYTIWKNTTNTRELAFEPLKQLCTRLGSTLTAYSPNQQTVDDYKTLNRKMQGAKLTKGDAGITETTTDANTEKIANTENAVTVKKVSTSQRSFDNQIEHFDKIIKLLASVTSYTPNETELKVATLQTSLANLKTVNMSAYNSYVALTNARINRNKILYGDVTGLIYIARGIKAYVKGKFGADSPEYAQVSAIKFVKVVKK